MQASLREPDSALGFFAFFHGLRSAPIPAPVIERAKWCLLDALGCGLFGSQQAWSKLMFQDALDEGSRGECTIYGEPQMLGAAPAALCNGTAIHGFELDDVIQEAIVHPGAVVVPAALAAAEVANASGAHLLRAIVAGYEAIYRVSMATGRAPSKRGFHMTGVAGPVASTVAAGVVMGLSADELASAVGLACSSAGSIKSFAAGHGGGMVKRMHAGRAAETGVRMSRLAQRGFSGPPTALDGRYGLLEVFGGSDARPEYLHQGLGEKWAIDDVWVKIYPICGRIQGIVQQLQALRGGGALQPAAIRKITIGTSEDSIQHNGNPAPAETMEAQYSIPYCAAVGLTGDPGSPAEFELAAISDPARQALAGRVELKIDAECEAVYPRQFGARVAVHLARGETRESVLLDAHGTAAAPCSEQERIEKFSRLARFSGLACDAQAIVQAVRGLDQMSSVRELTRLLRV